MDTPQDLIIEPDLLARWLVIAGLIDMAATMLERRSGAWAAMAITAADAASEAMLGLVAFGARKPPGEKAMFGELLMTAETRLTIDSGLHTRLLQGHRERNSALHIGHEPRPETVEQVIRTARDLRLMVASTTSVLGDLGAVGPVRAVGQLVASPTIREALIAADEALGAEHYTDAVDEASIALDAAISRLEPSLRPNGPAPSMRVWPERDGRPEQLMKWVEQRLDQYETWIVAFAVGLPPVELQSLRRVLGQPIYFLDGTNRPKIFRDPAVELTPRVCEAAVLAAVDAIFRLWQSQALRPTEPWES